MSAKTPINLQDAFLNQIRKEAILTTVYLVNGFQLKGIVKGFDNFTVVLVRQADAHIQHAVSTITPSKPVNTNFSEPKPAETKDS